MPVDRPTFQESWHRVAGLTPRLRPVVQAVRQNYRGRRWQVLMDPGSGQHFRVSDPAYHFVALLDGRRSVAEAWELTGERHGDDAPTQGEAIRLLGQMYTSNLLTAELPPDAAGLFERRRKRVRKEVGGYMLNLLFMRVPVWDPDRFLDRWLPAVSWIFGPIGLVLWAVLIGAGLWSLAGRTPELADQAGNVLTPGNLPWLYVCLVGIKALHELGHGFACKRFGRGRHTAGEVHTVGIMLMVLTPVPYVDASSAWLLPGKWQRAFVGAAGMYVELAVAAVAAIVWSQTAEGALVHGLAYNLIFIAGVSTVLFNANPLIKFDGYYILSDLLETPNLYQRSKQYLTYLVRRYAYGVWPLENPAHSGGERFWFVIYGVASAVYRVFLMVVIILFVADKLFFIGMLFAVLALVQFLVIPAGKLVHYLAAHPEPHRVRARAVVVTLAFFGLLLGVLGGVPMPDRPRAMGVAEPSRVVHVHAGADGEVRRVLPTGTVVQAGDLVLDAANPELEARRDELVSQRQALAAQYRRAIRREPAERQALAQQLAAVDDQLADVHRELAELAIHAPIDGTWVSELDAQTAGHYLRLGEPIGYVAALDDLVVRVAADQHEGPRLVAASDAVRMRPAGRPDAEFPGHVSAVLPAGRRQLPSAALGLLAGGSIPTAAEDQRGEQTVEPYFELRITPAPGSPAPESVISDGLLPPTDRAHFPGGVGEQVHVRFVLPDRPLLSQWWRAGRQTVQRRFGL
jgi:putative peptide zinc metalloprotease protein